MRSWWITGCASGFGQALVRDLWSDGLHAGGVDHDGEGLAKLRENAPKGAPLEMVDVREPEKLRAAAEAAFPEGPDVVVANAGHGYFATVAEADPFEVRDLLEVNLLGVANTARAVLPALRSRAGTFVVLSSVAGRTVFAESGWYAASKHAVEALAEAIWLENAAWGVRVRIIQPGAFDTRFGATARRRSPARSADSPYDGVWAEWDRHKAGMLARGQQAELVSRAIRESVDRPEALLRVPVGVDAEAILARLDAVGPDASAACFRPTR
jgi:NADP-dependent 3-hydroxy acid dehydrogenase YdfG